MKIICASLYQSSGQAATTYLEKPHLPLSNLRKGGTPGRSNRIRDSRDPMLYVKNRTAGRLTPKERRQLLLWGTVLLLAMLCLIYLITPSGNPPQKPAPAQQETGNSNSTKPTSPGT